MTPNCNNCKYSTTIGLDCVCIGVKEPYKVSPTHYCKDWKASLETIADHIRQMSDQELATLLEISKSFYHKEDKRRLVILATKYPAHRQCFALI